MTKALLGFMTLAGLMAAVLAYVLAIISDPNPNQYPIFGLFFLGAGCFVLGGVPWTHTRGRRRLKATVLGLIGFAVGAPAGGYLGHVLYGFRPHYHESMEELGWIFVTMWVVALFLAFVGVRWALRFHRRRDANLDAAPRLSGM